MVKALYWIKMAIQILFRCVEIVAFILASCMCLYWISYGHDTLEEGCELIERITGYPISAEASRLILHKTNENNSVVIVEEYYSSKEKIMGTMEQLVSIDEHWTAASICQNDTYKYISGQLEQGEYIRSYDQFRVTCDINNGAFDYTYVNGDYTRVCLVDVDTKTIVLYILSTPSLLPLFPPFL